MARMIDDASFWERIEKNTDKIVKENAKKNRSTKKKVKRTIKKK